MECYITRGRRLYMSRKKETHLTELELDIMNILWDHDTDLTNNEIFDYLHEQGHSLSIASVSQLMKRLLDKKLVRVKSFKPSSRVYARTFEPIINKQDYLKDELNRLQKIISSNDHYGTLGLFQMLLGHSLDQSLSQSELEKLEKIFASSKDALHKEL